MSKTFKSTNGQCDVMIAEAGFADAIRLKNAITSGLQNGTYDRAFPDNDPQVYAALWPCLIKCTYKGVKITQATFEDVEAREDYFEIINSCIDENLRPFFKGVASWLDTLNNQVNTSTQNTKSETTPSLTQ